MSESALISYARLSLYSYRDVLASMKRKFGKEPSLEFAEVLIQQYNQWTEKADVVMRYETMLQDKEPFIRALAELFGISGVEPASIVEQLNALRYNNQGQKNPAYHKVNLYHKGHVTDGSQGSWVGTLDNALVKQIEGKYQSWFEANHYPIES